ncbi:MAG: hypothetical protein L3K52_09900 [Candidatus Thiothrix sulfatifontis]|nr:MAG: hypothetical protein L3K52_09900 [Candidatus Thiothrix sulfatifontis]
MTAPLSFKGVCLKRHELTSKLDSLHQCRNTLAEYNVATKGVDGIIEARSQELEALTLDIDDRKALIDKFIGIRTHRQFHELPSSIRGLRSEITNGQAAVERKRQALVDSGIQAEEAGRIIADYDASESLQKLEPLESELAEWVSFSETGLASDLPPNAQQLFESYEDFGSGCQRPQNLYSLNCGV